MTKYQRLTYEKSVQMEKEGLTQKEMALRFDIHQSTVKKESRIKIL